MWKKRENFPILFENVCELYSIFDLTHNRAKNDAISSICPFKWHIRNVTNQMQGNSFLMHKRQCQDDFNLLKLLLHMQFVLYIRLNQWSRLRAVMIIPLKNTLRHKHTNVHAASNSQMVHKNVGLTPHTMHIQFDIFRCPNAERLQLLSPLLSICIPIEFIWYAIQSHYKCAACCHCNDIWHTTETEIEAETDNSTQHMESGNRTVYLIGLILIFDRYRAHFSNWNGICGAFTCIWCSVLGERLRMPCRAIPASHHAHQWFVEHSVSVCVSVIIETNYDIAWIDHGCCCCLHLPLEPHVRVYHFNRINRKRIFAFAIQTVWVRVKIVSSCVPTHSIWTSRFLNFLSDQTERMSKWKKESKSNCVMRCIRHCQFIDLLLL